MRKIREGSAGVTLVELLIAAGVLAVTVGGFAQLMVSTQSQIRDIRQSAGFESELLQIYSILRSQKFCGQMFAGTTLPTSSFDATTGEANIPVPTLSLNGRTILAVNGTYNNFQVKSMKFDRRISSAGTNTELLNFNITAENITKKADRVDRDFRLVFILDSARAVIACHADEGTLAAEVCDQMGAGWTWDTSILRCVPPIPTGEQLCGRMGLGWAWDATLSKCVPPPDTAERICNTMGTAWSWDVGKGRCLPVVLNAQLCSQFVGFTFDATAGICVPPPAVPGSPGGPAPASNGNTSSPTLANKTCPDGEYLQGFDGNGNLICKSTSGGKEAAGSFPSGSVVGGCVSSGIMKSGQIFSCWGGATSNSCPPGALAFQQIVNSSFILCIKI